MKKILLVSGMLFATIMVKAQERNIYLGGVFGIQSDKSEDYTVNVVSKDFSAVIAPEFGFFLKDNLAVGLAFNMSNYKFDNDVADSDYDKMFLLSPVIYARKFWNIEEVFSVFAGFDINVSTGNYKENRNGVLSTTDKISGFGANLNVGITYPLGKRFTAVGKYGLFGYSSVTYKDDAGVKQSTDSEFGFNVNSLGSLFNIGLYYNLRSKGE